MLIRVMTWIEKFLTNTRSFEKIKSSLRTTEFNKAYKILIKLVHQFAFSTEIKVVSAEKMLTLIKQNNTV